MSMEKDVVEMKIAESNLKVCGKRKRGRPRKDQEIVLKKMKVEESMKRKRGRPPALSKEIAKKKKNVEEEVKRKPGRPRKVQTKVAEKDIGEDVCFICYDGGDLVLCDRRECPKAYHPGCIDRDVEFFHSRDRWYCGWHVCSNCEKGLSARYMCYTCTSSRCKSCIKEADFFCVRGNNGFCKACMRTIELIDKNEQGNSEMAQVRFGDKNSWEYLFKDYWIDLKGKLSLTSDELGQAKKRCFLENHEESSYEKRSKSWSNSSTREEGCSSEARADSGDGLSMLDGTEWASKELLDFVSHVKNGSKAVLSHFEVKALLLEYIRRNNLRDPYRKCQIVCDSRLENLFGKACVGHFEMLKLLESHFLVEKNPQGGIVNTEAKFGAEGNNEALTKVWTDKKRRICKKGEERRPQTNLDESSLLEAEGNNEALTKEQTDKKHRSCKKGEERRPQTNLDEYAAIDVHNINLLYLQRNFIEDLIEDTDKFYEKVVGSFVRIRISGLDKKQDTYRLVQVVGIGRAAEPYKIGKRATNVMLKILNLNKTENIPIDIISDQKFSEDECNCLRQSILCGSIRQMKVGEVQEKAIALQAVKVDDLLNTPEERLRRLNEVPEVHTDPNMDPFYEAKYDEAELDNIKQVADNHPKPREDGSDPDISGYITAQDIISPSSMEIVDTPLQIASLTGPNETDKVWHYHGPSGKIQGPFSMVQLLEWSTSYFPANMRIWRTNKKQEDSILLIDVFNERFRRELAQLENGFSQHQKVIASCDNSTCTDEERSNIGSISNVKYASDLAVVRSCSTEVIQSPNVGEIAEVWHYRDPSGKIQGPCSMAQLLKLSTISFFPANLRIWRTTEREEDSILLTHALDEGFHKELPQSENSFSQPQKITASIDNNRANNSTWTDEKRSDGSGISNVKYANDPAVVTPGASFESEATSYSAGVTQLPNVSETAEVWHYWDPSRKIQGPVSMAWLRNLSTTSFFTANLRIWRTTEKEEDSILLTHALDEWLHKELAESENSFPQPQKVTASSDNYRENNSTWVDEKQSESSGISNGKYATDPVVVTQSSNVGETTEVWHYQDPSGKIQGPFSMAHLLKWSTSPFSANLRIWRTTENKEDSILLTRALDEWLHIELSSPMSSPTQALAVQDPEPLQISSEYLSTTNQPRNNSNQGFSASDNWAGPPNANSGDWFTSSTGAMGNTQNNVLVSSANTQSPAMFGKTWESGPNMGWGNNNTACGHQLKSNGNRLSGRSNRGFHGHGSSRPSASFGEGGGSFRHPKPWKVCIYHDKGYCKKGAHCTFLHQ